MSFTFLNLSGAPNLGPSESRLMRAHVTRANFAQRRQRISKQMRGDKGSAPRVSDVEKESGQLSSSRLQHQTPCPSAVAWPESETLLLLRPTDPYLAVGFLLREYRPLVFPAGTGDPGTPSEANWIGLVRSESALLEASLAIAVRYRPVGQPPREADRHLYRATRLINQRLESDPTDLSDGLISAVFTLGYSEFLKKNEAAFHIHVDGLAQMIRLRVSQHDNAMPKWLKDQVLHEAVSEAVSASGGHYYKAVDALGDARSKECLDNLANVSRQLAKLRQSLDAVYMCPTGPEFAAREINERICGLFQVLELLPTKHISYLRPLKRAIRLFLHLSWPPCADVSPAELAEDLWHALDEPELKLCSSLDLTVWQFFVGATGAELRSETRSWYEQRLRRIFLSMQVFDWKGVLEVLPKSFIPTQPLLQEFKTVWKEIGGMQ